MSPDALAVVMVTHDSAAYVGRTLAALSPQLREGDEVVVVDNASSDGTAAAVHAGAPHVRVLAQGRNLGFAGGASVGAQATTAPLLLFLNPDARPAPDCLEALRQASRERPDWGAWQALVTMEDGAAINTAG